MFTKQQLLCTCMRAVLDLQLVIVSSIAKTSFFFLARTFWHATLVPNVVCVWFMLYSNLFLYFLAFLAAWQSMPFKLIIKNNNVAAKIETKLKQSGGKHSDLGSR